MAFTGRLGSSDSRLGNIVLGAGGSAAPPPAAPTKRYTVHVEVGEVVSIDGVVISSGSLPEGIPGQKCKNIYTEIGEVIPYSGMVISSRSPRSDGEQKAVRVPIMVMGDEYFDRGSVIHQQATVPQGPYTPITIPAMVSCEVQEYSGDILTYRSKPSETPKPQVHFFSLEVPIVESNVISTANAGEGIQPEVGLRYQNGFEGEVLPVFWDVISSSCNPRVLPEPVRPHDPVARVWIDDLNRVVEATIISYGSPPSDSAGDGQPSGDRIRPEGSESDRTRPESPSASPKIAGSRSDPNRIRSSGSGSTRTRPNREGGDRRRP
ncbi:MAG: hypothetical protein HC888_00505 [Candidatus Competibacteraceae bacterium]|nr:hypothetical protein [Candidatus Competibacteraceae bacterium]